MANKEKERRVIERILHNNKYDASTLNLPRMEAKKTNWFQMGKIHICRKRDQTHY
jgi:hypothetical protein